MFRNQSIILLVDVDNEIEEDRSATVKDIPVSRVFVASQKVNFDNICSKPGDI